MDLPRFAAFAIQLFVFTSLFSGLPGPATLGELRGEGTIIGAVLVIVSTAAVGAIVDVRAIKSAAIFLPLLVCVALGYAVNADDIANAHFLGRQGGEKFLTSLLVLGFYFSIFFAVSCLANVYGVRALLWRASDAAVWCGFLLVAEMAVEIASWYLPPLREAWGATRQVWVTSAASEPLFRLVGFAPEPSLNALTAMGLMGLLGARHVISRESRLARGATRGGGGALFLIGALLSLELLLANTRTFLVGALGAVVALVLLGRFAQWLPRWMRSMIIVLAPLPVQALLMWSVLKSDIGALSVSNITRSVGMITASRLWASHPLLGLGLGQYGFHFRDVVPPWGMESFEVSKFFREDQYDLLAGLQPSFSLFTRVAAELGLLGLAAWLLPPFLAIRKAIRQGPEPLGIVIVCALAAELWSGLSLDSFRNAYYWLFLAAGLALLSSQAADDPCAARAASVGVDAGRPLQRGSDGSG